MTSGVNGEPAKYLNLAEVKLPTQRSGKSGKLVVKHTFLELETRTASVDSLPEFGRVVRASSDPCILENPKYNLDLAADDMIGDGAGQPLGAQEDIVMTGLSDSDGDFNRSEDESTAHPSQSGNGVEGGSSSWESGVDDEQPQPVKAAAHEVTTPQKPPSDLKLLANENTRLAAENAFLRQQCMEVAKAAQTAAAATASAAAVYWVDPDAPADSQADAHAMTALGATPTMLPAAGQRLPATQGQPPPSPSGTEPSTSYTPMAFFGGNGSFDGPPNGAFWFQMPKSGYPVLIQENALPVGAVMASMPPATAASCAGVDSPQVRQKEIERVKSSMRPKGRGATAQRAARGAHGARGCADDASMPDESSGAPCTVPPEERTTVMLRNVPNNYTRQMLIDLLESEGFSRQYDFIYLPADFKSRASLGYAFVNLTSPSAAVSFMKVFNGFSNWILPSRKICGVNWSGPHQGLAAHIERYRNSPVMHEAVPDAYKPAVFQDGVRVSFPLPTKRLREPRVRHFHASSLSSGFQNESQDAPSGAREPEAPATRVGKAKQDLADLSGDEQWWF